MKKLYLLTLVLAFAWAAQAQKTLISEATLHLGNGQVIENGYLGINHDGSIDYVGQSAPLESYEHNIVARGQHVYPGFILPNTTLGLVEIAAVRASRDQAETGAFNPNVRSLIAYNCESDIIPTVIDNGVLVAQITPRSGRISGSSSIVSLECWNWEDAAIKTDDGIHLNWPAPVYRTGWWAEPGIVKRNEKYDEQLQELKQYLSKAKGYSSGNAALLDLKMQSMAGLFSAEKTLFIHSNSAAAMLDAMALCQDLGIEKLVFVGGYEAHLIMPELKAAGVGIILRRLHELPMHPDDPMRLPYQLPAKLTKAGIKVALDMSGDMEQIQGRNLPFLAGTAAAYGLSNEEALKLITLNAAEILGIEEHVGSLEKGKWATLFISKGNALEPATNAVVAAFSKGQKIDLSDNRQKELYEKYKKKYE